MFCEQVKFYDEANNLCFGIRAWTDADNWLIICAHCGEILYPEDVHDVETLGYWVDFSDYIK